jgi:hypothetical protein
MFFLALLGLKYGAVALALTVAISPLLLLAWDLMNSGVISVVDAAPLSADMLCAGSLIIALVFAVPFLIGGTVLGFLLAHCSKKTELRPSRGAIWGGVVGFATTVIALLLLSELVLPSERAPGDRVFLGLALTWGAVLFSWVGRRLAVVTGSRRSSDAVP